DDDGMRDLAVQLTQSSDLESVERAVAKAVARGMERVAVFTKRDSMVLGALQINCPIQDGDFRQISFSLMDTQLFRGVEGDRRAHLAPSELSALDKRLIAS